VRLPLGRLERVTLAAGSPEATLTKYTYDAQGNRTQQTDAEGRTTRFEFDRGAKETARVLPLGQRESRTYRPTGEVQSHTDFAGKTTHFGYDPIGRLIAIDYPNDPDVAFEYTPSGQRAMVADGNRVTTYSYDRRDRLLRKVDPEGYAVDYQYDPAGNLTSRISTAETLAYTYDARNRQTSVTATRDGEPPRITRYEYDAVGNRTLMISADGVRTEYAYDARYRLKTLTKRTSWSALLFAASYTVDADGLRTRIVESDGSGTTRTVAYTYDGLNRLVSETIAAREANRSRASAWSYDKVGNRLSQSVAIGTNPLIMTSYIYDANDRLTSESTAGSTTAYAYDANGNTIRKEAPGELVEYAYDDAHRLTELRKTSGQTTYAYDVDGLRVAQTQTPARGPTVSTHYVLDTNRPYGQVIEEWTSTDHGAPQLAVVLTFGDELLSQRLDGRTHFLHADGLGSTRLLTDSTGLLTDLFEYDAFGNTIARIGITHIDYLHRSEQLDSNLGFYYLRARYYDPGAGRFTQQDDYMGDNAHPASLHKYRYANSDPVNGSDPSGNMTLMDLGIAQDIQAALRTIGAQGLRQYVKRAVTETLLSPRALFNEVKKCIRNSRRCDLSIPILITGADTPHTAQHIRDAQTGAGSALLTSPFLLTRKFPPARAGWYRAKRECKGMTGLLVGKDCDEFPYRSTNQGGPSNYPSRVSLRPVPAWESALQGGKLSVFYSICGIAKQSTSPIPTRNKAAFLAIGVPELPVTIPICAR
jgi:RHS repeat-associated protein